MKLIFLIWVVLALITCARNIYVQLVLADNWPPTHWHRIQWEAVIMLLTASLFAWPFIVFLMIADEKTRHKKTEVTPCQAKNQP